MMKGQKDRMVRPESPKKLVCLKECEAPGYGAWKPGDVIEDPKLVDYLEGNPNFESKEDQ